MSFLLSDPTHSTRRSIANAAPTAPSMHPFLLEHQRVALQLGDHPVAGHELPAQDLLRQGVLDLRLNGTLQGPCTIHRVEARFADLVARVIVQSESDVALRQSLP